jgi:hypothetical protein
LHKLQPGKVIPEEGELESFLSYPAPSPQPEPDSTNFGSPSMGKIVINDMPPPPEILDSDSGPSDDDEVFHHATPVVNPVLPARQPGTVRKGTIGDLPRKPVAMKPAPQQLNVNPYPVASPTPLSFGGTSISSHPVSPHPAPTPTPSYSTQTPSTIPSTPPHTAASYGATTGPTGMFSGLDVHSAGTPSSAPIYPTQTTTTGRPAGGQGRPQGGVGGGAQGGQASGASGLFAGLDTHM